jgi:putative hydroxymethylpyrimidine transporter CytX
MSTEKTSVLNSGLLWFGAAVSIAEILTGTLIAPLGFTKGTIAIIFGHIIGCALLYFAGLIGANTGMYAIESSRISFGKQGSYIFSVLNILQLIGWTAVMIIGAAKAMSAISKSVMGFESNILWSAVVGILIILWVVVGMKNLGKVNIIAVGGLFILTVLLSTVVFKSTSGAAITDSMSFGMAVELSVAMPLSWLPLISDYTRNAKKPRLTTFVSSASYFIGSSWMYIIGLGAAIYAGNSDIAQILMSAGLSFAAMIIVIMSTVTTTFLDVFSAGASFTNMSKKLSEKWAAIIVCIIGIVIAMFTPIEQYQNFLYLIGSAFAPMTAILLTDYFILGKKEVKQSLNIFNIILWVAGFFIYRRFLSIDTPVGSTVPVMIIVSLLSILIYGGRKLCLKKSMKM